MTIIPEIIDPDYEYITIIGKITYNPSKTSLTADEILTLVRAAITDYNNAELKRFDSVFRKSKLQNYMENAERSITGSDIQIYLQKRHILTLGTSENVRVKFNVPLRKGDYVSKLFTFPEAKVYDLTNILRNVYVEEVPESFTGVEEIVIENPGINYTSTPTIRISGDGIGAAATAKIVNGRISTITVTNRGTNYSRATVYIEGGGGSEATATAMLEARTGVLRTFYYEQNGEKVIINPNAGTIDYDTGEIFLESFNAQSLVENDFYPADVLTFNIPSQSEIIMPLRNRIISFDEGDPFALQLTLEAE